jgi:hypothetical protein
MSYEYFSLYEMLISSIKSTTYVEFITRSSGELIALELVAATIGAKMFYFFDDHGV